MAKITVGVENSAAIELYYEDHGSGAPVVLIHGFPLNGHAFERQEAALLDAGYRVITYDRRGYGQSDKPHGGYDYDTLASDLNTLIERLDLREAVLVGFSMGTGEVTRYLGTYGSARVGKAVLLAAIPPFLPQSAENPEGVDPAVFAGIKAAIAQDRYAFFPGFFADFFNTDVYEGTRVSPEAVQAGFTAAVAATGRSTLAVVDAWLEDFRGDLARIDVPVLVVHGDADRILPHAATAARLPRFLPHAVFVTVEGGPHNIAWTHAEVVNTALLEFLGD